MPSFDPAAAERLFEPLGAAKVLADNWGRRAVHLPGSPDRVAGIFGREAFDQLLRTDERGDPFRQQVRIKARYFVPKDNREEEVQGVPRYLASALHDAGMTLCVSGLESDPSLQGVLGAVRTAARFSGELTSGLYVSPDTRGFGYHYDCEHGFIIQLEGAKQWQLSREPALRWPPYHVPSWLPRDGRDDPRLLALGEPIAAPPEGPDAMHVLLKAGDVLYMPPGTWHRTAAQQSSMSLSLAFHPLHFGRLLRAAWAVFAMQDPAWRKADPDPATIAALLAEAAARFAALTPEGLVDAYRQVLASDPARPPSYELPEELRRFSEREPPSFATLLLLSFVEAGLSRVEWRRDLNPDTSLDDRTAALAARLAEAREELSAMGPDQLLGPREAAQRSREVAELLRSAWNHF